MEAGVQSDVWAVHVTRLDDFSPVTEGSLTLLWQSATGDSDSLTVDQPARPGIFLPTPTIESAGTYDVYVIVGGPQLQDRIPAGRIEVYSDHTDVPHDAQNAVDNSISFLKEQQWPIEFGMTTVTERNVRSSFDVLGTVEAAAGRMAEVAATVDGLLHTESNLETPFEGSLVTKGDILVAPTEATPIQFVL